MGNPSAISREKWVGAGGVGGARSCCPTPDRCAIRAERLVVALGVWSPALLAALSESKPEVGLLSLPLSSLPSLPSLASLAQISPSSKSCAGPEVAGLLGVGGTMTVSLGLNLFGSFFLLP